MVEINIDREQKQVNVVLLDQKLINRQRKLTMDLLPARTLSLHWGQSVAYQMLLIFPLLGKKSKKARLLFSYDDNW